MKFNLSLSCLIAFFLADFVHGRELALVDRYPSLKEIPRLELVPEVTPVHGLTVLEKHLKLPTGTLLVKRDDRSTELLGGNKARKLEFLLGPLAQEKNPQDVTLVTTGMWGSNHALATAIVGHLYGFKVLLQLGPQPVTPKVKEKLLGFHVLGAHLKFFSHKIWLGFGILGRTLQDLFTKRFVYFPPGGSQPLGNLGYVDAYLEMESQLKNSKTPLPQEIYLPMGTAGTSAGLWVGSCLAGTLDEVTIHSIGISHSFLSNGRTIEKMARKTYRLIRESLTEEDLKNFPDCQFKLGKGLVYHKEFSAPGYGAATPQVFETIALVKKLEGITLEQTYTGKAFNGMLQLLARKPVERRQEKILYWHTYNAFSMQSFIEAYPWQNPEQPWLELPKKFRALF